jgi:hypothetical protein
MARTKAGSSRTDLINSSKSSKRSADAPEQGDYLRSIDKLLNAVSELMKRESKIDRNAFEYLRRLRVRIRFAITEKDQSSSGLIKIPRKWLDRIDRTESPVVFIRREYAELIGKIARSDIKRIDKSLYAALCNWISINGELPPDLDLPTKKQAYDRKIERSGPIRTPTRTLKVSEMSAGDAEQLRLYDVLRRRKKRQTKAE